MVTAMVVIIPKAETKDKGGIPIAIGVSTIRVPTVAISIVIIVIVVVAGAAMAVPIPMAMIPALSCSTVPAVHFLQTIAE
jgi:hypothetical protein